MCTEPRPTLEGPEDLTEGYSKLEAAELFVAERTYAEHREAIKLWYQSLTLYRRGMLGRWTHRSLRTCRTYTSWLCKDN